MDNLYVYIIFVALNIYGAIIMYMDKQRAINNKWRISEKHIWTVAVIGGALGATYGMKTFRHKTKHSQFKILLPLLAVVNVVSYIYILAKLS
jgi:uncharacterized membrane protein YsdA (DUF1294 family)